MHERFGGQTRALFRGVPEAVGLHPQLPGRPPARRVVRDRLGRRHAAARPGQGHRLEGRLPQRPGVDERVRGPAKDGAARCSRPEVTRIIRHVSWGRCLVPTLCVGTHLLRRSASAAGDAERRGWCVPTVDRGNEETSGTSGDAHATKDAYPTETAMAHTIVIFGASGDLTSRKLIPALYELYRKKRLPREDADRRLLAHAVHATTPGARSWPKRRPSSSATNFDAAAWAGVRPVDLLSRPGDIDNAEDFASLAEFLGELEGDGEATRVYYLSTAPQFYAPAIAQLGAAGLADEGRGPRRVVIEKPFGTDLATARRAERAGPRGLRRAARSIASTTTWARRRCRTCWCCGSPTASSSRSGTATTSTTCRSRRPRR